MKSKRVARKFAVNLAIFLSLVAVLGVVVILLWNALVPEIFDGPTLNYWQAAGALLLSYILLRGTPSTDYGRGVAPDAASVCGRGGLR